MARLEKAITTERQENIEAQEAEEMQEEVFYIEEYDEETAEVGLQEREYMDITEEYDD